MKAILSDQHCHRWTHFSETGSDGVNSRLRIILDEMRRAAKELKAAGGRHMIFAGDLFHRRGAIEPEVFNPTHELIQEILGMDIEIHAIPGNHDNADKNTTELGNAIQTLAALDGFHVYSKPAVRSDVGVVMIPWIADVAELKATLADLAAQTSGRQNLDLILHAGIDGVLPGIPDHGLSGQDLATLGFRNVFAGHYHNHKMVVPGVYSIGATTQQTFGDVQAKAGFLLVDADGQVNYRSSHAPRFVDLTSRDDPSDYFEIVDANYVRVRDMELDDQEVALMRDHLISLGAKGITFQVSRKTVVARTNNTSAKGMTLEQSIDKYIGEQAIVNSAEVVAACGDILSYCQSIAINAD